MPTTKRVCPVPKIAAGHILTHAQAELVTGQSIQPRVFDWIPQGARLLICKDTIPEKIGSIIMPVETNTMTSAGSGWIIGCGPDAGIGHQMPIGNVIVDDNDPANLLGLHVSFTFSAGKSMRFSLYDSDYDSQVGIYSPVDVLMVDYNSNPLEADKRSLETWTEREVAQVEADKAPESEAYTLEGPSAIIVIPGS